MREKVRERGREVRHERAKREGRWAGWGNEKEKENRAPSSLTYHNNTTTFFFTNYPEECSFHVLWRTFQRYGKVADIFIPRKRNKEGKKFGFVRFLEDSNVVSLERKMRDVWIDLYKLRVNRPRFQKDKEEAASKGGVLTVDRSRGDERKRSGPENTKGSYAQIVKGVPNEVAGGGKVDVVKEGTRSGEGRQPSSTRLSYKTSSLNEAWLFKTMVGELVADEDTHAVQQKMFSEGILSVRVIPMGGRKVCLKEETGRKIEDTIKDHADWFGRWMEGLHKWSTEDMGYERSAWVRCFGIPLHAWEQGFFKSLASLLGRFVKVDERTTNNNFMDYADILIITDSCSSLDSVFQVLINEVCYKIKVVEVFNGVQRWCSSSNDLEQIERYEASEGGESSRSVEYWKKNKFFLLSDNETEDEEKGDHVAQEGEVNEAVLGKAVAKADQKSLSKFLDSHGREGFRNTQSAKGRLDDTGTNFSEETWKRKTCRKSNKSGLVKNVQVLEKGKSTWVEDVGSGCRKARGPTLEYKKTNRPNCSSPSFVPQTLDIHSTPKSVGSQPNKVGSVDSERKFLSGFGYCEEAKDNSAGTTKEDSLSSFLEDTRDREEGEKIKTIVYRRKRFSRQS